MLITRTRIVSASFFYLIITCYNVRLSVRTININFLTVLIFFRKCFRDILVAASFCNLYD